MKYKTLKNSKSQVNVHPTGEMVAEHCYKLCSAVVQQVHSDMDSQVTGEDKHSADHTDQSQKQLKEKADNRKM